jgi:hypothetical protein
MCTQTTNNPRGSTNASAVAAEANKAITAALVLLGELRKSRTNKINRGR